jgi:hypothetical protein
MKTLLTVMGLTAALAFALSCGGDSDKNGGGDKGVTLPDSGGGQQDTGGGQQDTGGGQQDTGGGQQDTGPPPTGPNSGQTCDQSTPCPTGDECLLLQGWAKGICFGPCAKQGDTCSTADTTKYLSTCALTDQSQTKWYCLYVCEAQGQTYECPDPTTQECVASTTAGIKICKPK